MTVSTNFIIEKLTLIQQAQQILTDMQRSELQASTQQNHEIITRAMHTAQIFLGLSNDFPLGDIPSMLGVLQEANNGLNVLKEQRIVEVKRKIAHLEQQKLMFPSQGYPPAAHGYAPIVQSDSPIAPQHPEYSAGLQQPEITLLAEPVAHNLSSMTEKNQSRLKRILDLMQSLNQYADNCENDDLKLLAKKIGDWLSSRYKNAQTSLLLSEKEIGALNNQDSPLCPIAQEIAALFPELDKQLNPHTAAAKAPRPIALPALSRAPFSSRFFQQPPASQEINCEELNFMQTRERVQSYHRQLQAYQGSSKTLAKKISDWLENCIITKKWMDPPELTTAEKEKLNDQYSPLCTIAKRIATLNLPFAKHVGGEILYEVHYGLQQELDNYIIEQRSNPDLARKMQSWLLHKMLGQDAALPLTQNEQKYLLEPSRLSTIAKKIAQIYPEPALIELFQEQSAAVRANGPSSRA